MKVSAIITAAGIGKRMAADKPKQFLHIAGKPILFYTLKKFDQCEHISEIIIVTEKGWRVETKELAAQANLTKSWKIVAGGAARQDSVNNGLHAVATDTDIVVIHDGVRPLIKKELIDESIKVAAKEGACIIATPIIDTVKKSKKDDVISETIDRRELWGAQTPQTFKYNLIKEAFDKAYEDGFYGTDDASLVERIGEKVSLVTGDRFNIKITTPEDLELANAILQKGRSMRIGTGYDLHKLIKDRKLIIGGVEIDYELGLLGHSDADVLLHAITDAILGAAGLGDIGKHFPDTDNKYKGANSRELLKTAYALVQEKGLSIENIDATIIAERPKMLPHIEKMRNNISEDLGIKLDQINIKATTSEGLGFIGRKEAIAAEAIALLK